MVSLYDTHAHLDYPEFAAEIPEILERARTAGVSRIYTIATDLNSSARAIQIAEQFPQVFAVIGWHPSDADKAPEDVRPALRELARHPKVVGLGEMGIDYHRLPSQQPGGTPELDAPCKRKQAQLFLQHLEVAAELGLSCVIHQRDALEDTMALFEPFANRVRAVFHCFANDAATMRRILALGSLVSFTGILTFKSAQNIRNTLAATPLDGFMLETDSPFLAPVPYRGKRCEPAYVKETALAAAQIKACSLAQLAAATSATAEQFFARKQP